MPNQQLGGEIFDYADTIDRVEVATGINFFANYPSRITA